MTARIYEASNSRAFAAIREAPVPVIAAIRGICYGGGFGLAAAADLRLASAEAVFAVPAAKLGLAYPADAVQDFVRGLGSQLARKALFTGAPLKAEEGGGFDVVCSRAFASLVDFTTWSSSALKPGAVWMAMKGKHPADEIAALPASVSVFHVEQLVVPGLDAERCIVWLRAATSA